MEQLIRHDLLADEYIIWHGQPNHKKFFTIGDLFIIPFSLVWLSFSIFWAFMAIQMDAPWYFVLFDLPFLLIGLYMILGRCFYTAYVLKRTYYYITNRRAIILKQTRHRKIEARFMDRISGVNKNVNKSGEGTLIFNDSLNHISPLVYKGLEFLIRNSKDENLPLAFLNIKDIDQAYRIANDVKSGQYY